MLRIFLILRHCKAGQFQQARSFFYLFNYLYYKDLHTCIEHYANVCNCIDLYTIALTCRQLHTTDHKRTQASTEKHKRGAKSYILFFAGVCTMYMYLYMNLYLYLYLNMNMYLYMYMIMYLYMSALRAALFWKNQQSAFFQKKFNFCA